MKELLYIIATVIIMIAVFIWLQRLEQRRIYNSVGQKGETYIQFCNRYFTRYWILIPIILLSSCSITQEIYTTRDCYYLKGNRVFSESGAFDQRYLTPGQAAKALTKISLNDNVDYLPKVINEILQSSMLVDETVYKSMDTITLHITYNFYPDWQISREYIKRTDFPIWFTGFGYAFQGNRFSIEPKL